jgi:large subunit ribosomal protein L28
MAKCEICSKSTKFGRSISRSKKSTNRQFKPNVQRKRVMIDGRMQRIYICTRCLRTLNKS